MVTEIRSSFIMIVVGILAVSGRPATAASLEVLVPAYFYPGGNSYWQDLTTAAGSIGVNAILNPASGPGTAADTNYVTAVDNLRAAGGRVLGYVPTTFGARNEVEVKADVDKYIAFYHVDGIFLDEMTNDNTSAHLTYYSDLYSYIKTQSSAYRVIGNPGTNTQESYLTRPTADALVTFEDNSGAYAGYTPASWVANYSPNHFGQIVHTAPGQELGTLLSLAQQRNAGLVYVTDDTLPNPYDTLPSYWNQEVADIALLSAPEPSAFALAALGLLAMGFVRRRRTRGQSVPAT